MYNYPMYYIRYTKYWKNCTCTIFEGPSLNFGKMYMYTYPKYSIKLTTCWKIVRIHFSREHLKNLSIIQHIINN
jgi:hypothetical protein